MSTPKVIHVNDMADYPGAVYVGRAVPRRRIKVSKWANRYKIGDVVESDEGNIRAITRKWSIELYEELLTVIEPGRLADLPELRNAPALACWCAPERCHADVLVSLLERYTDDELLVMASAS